MKFIFARHGQTDTNVKSERGEIILEDDAPLNATGLEQAKAVAQALKNEKVDAIFVSTYKRALETAKEIAAFHDTEFIKMDSLKERDGGDLVQERWHDLFDFDKNLGGGDIETVGEFFQRIYDTIDQIRESGFNTVIVVSHGGVYHAFQAYFEKLEWKGDLRIGRLKNCKYRVFEI